MAFSDIQTILIFSIPLLFAITLHECAHGWVASRCGDHTAKMMGRLTLNPIKHIDAVGTILVPTILYFSSGMIFGWAKPVPINYSALRSPKKDMLWVAAAGPLANFIMAVIWLIVYKVGISINYSFLSEIGRAGIYINLILAVINLLPIPPLDGARMVDSLLPPRLSYEYAKLEPYGLFILLGLLFLGIFQNFILPIVSIILNFMFFVIGILI